MEALLSPGLRLYSTGTTPAPLICFSHLRWDFVLQRPQHLMNRFAAGRKVLFVEEFIPTHDEGPFMELRAFEGTKVVVARPHIPHGFDETRRETALAKLFDELIAGHGGASPILWFYSPMMFPLVRTDKAGAVVFDCMDELSAFRFAPAELKQRERDLMARADVVFTGGTSIFKAKRSLHDNIHVFPSSVDAEHFSKARLGLPDPTDQAAIPHPRLGYYGVIDERIDLDLLATVAREKPGWSFVMVGPFAKIDPAALPRAANIHYLGQKDYGALPAYLSGWDVALMPFAINDSTRFISPTKTPEYLAGGCPIVSTAITDVVHHYGATEGVVIAADHADFLTGCEKALELSLIKPQWLPEIDRMLSKLSWDETFFSMNILVEEANGRQSEPVAVLPSRKPAVLRLSETARYDYLVVGAGFSGAVMAERLAAGSGKRVLVCDRRSHIGGNAYDEYDAAGILIHRYGPHIFHTNSSAVVDYLSRFTQWRPYEHRVLASVDGMLLPMPINRTTLNGVYGLDLATEAQAQAFFTGLAQPVERIETSRDVVVSQVGEKLYRTFFEGYTRKQWGLDPAQLDKSVTSRVPARMSDDDRYFLDTFQAMPRDGYTRMFENMLDHDRIDIALDTDYFDLRDQKLAPRTIFTGPVDSFFDHRFGKLPYRSLSFRHETHDMRRFQPVAVVNFPDQAVPHTRITEYKHLTGQVAPRTSISYEFAIAEGDPYYPIPRPENQALYKRYEALGRTREDVTFAGRLGTYKYYNMDQVVGQALATYRRMIAEKPEAVLALVES